MSLTKAKIMHDQCRSNKLIRKIYREVVGGNCRIFYRMENKSINPELYQVIEGYNINGSIVSYGWQYNNNYAAQMTDEQFTKMLKKELRRIWQEWV